MYRCKVTDRKMKGISVIIPSLDPDTRLSGVVNGLLELGFTDIILVDDGSKQENKKFFPKGEYITLLTHEENFGKGAALKTAIKYISENRPDSVGAVTCDGDGQHLAHDIKRVAEEMLSTELFILGVRDFSGPDVPFKSKLGNKLSSLALALFSGVKTNDTQTGLRAFPAKLYKPLSEVKGSRFEYETNVLLELSHMNCGYKQIKIDTVYLDENKGSHYRPLIDSIRIMSLMIKYVFSSVLSYVVDISLFALFHSVFLLPILSSTVIARLLSSIINFTLNRKIVFKSGVSVVKSLGKYYLLAIPTMLISGFGLKIIASLLNISDGSAVMILLKTVIDIFLFIINFTLQKTWIFKKK